MPARSASPGRRLGSGGDSRRRPPRAARPRSAWPTIVLFVAPALLLFVVLVLVPIVQADLLQPVPLEWAQARSTDFVGFDNYSEALADPVFLRRDRAQRSHHRAVAGGPAPVRAGPGAAAQPAVPGRGLLRAIFFAPYVLSEVITAVVFQLMLAPDGLVDRRSGGRPRRVRRRGSPTRRSCCSRLFVVISWKYFGFHMILFLAGLQGIPQRARARPPRSTAPAVAGDPAHHPAAARPDHPRVASSCR